MKITITGAAGQIAKSVIPALLDCRVFGDRKLELNLLDITPCLGKLEGVAMELQDCAYDNLARVTVTDQPQIAFKGADLIIFLGGFPRKTGMERKDLLLANKTIYELQGKAIAELGLTQTRCLVVANPANTNALILRKYATTLKEGCISCLTRLDQNRAVSQLSTKLSMPLEQLGRVIIWGNHSSTMVPDLSFAVRGGAPLALPADYLPEFSQFVRKRGGDIIEKLGNSSTVSAAKAVIDHIRDWQDSHGKWVSMGVVSTGTYAIKGLIVSVPVVCKDFCWQQVPALQLNPDLKEKIKVSVAELVAEGTEAGVWP